MPLRSLKSSPTMLLLLVGSIPLASCSKGPAYGSEDAIVVALAPTLRPSLEPMLESGLERVVFTTREEGIFELTFTDPASIGDFRKWRRVVIIEPLPEAVLLPEIVDFEDDAEIVDEIDDRWALDQTVWVFGADSREATERLVADRIDELFDSIHERHVEHQIERMWASGRDTELSDALVEELGFGLVLPRVYRRASEDEPPATRTYYNDEPRRIVSLHWVAAPAELTVDFVLDERLAWGEALFSGDRVSTVPLGSPRSDAETDDTLPGLDALVGSPSLQLAETELGGIPAVRVQGVWQNPEDVTAGLFLAYGLVCGDRFVLLDGNLYAPDRHKYPYLIQFEEIFRTFRCALGDTASE